MKRIAIVLVVALVGGAALVAQPARGPMMGRGFGQGMQTTQEAPKTITIEGKLSFVDGHPAVQAKDKTYMLNMPRFYYYAYTDGIKEGAQVKAEGYAMPTVPGQDKPYFSVTKATIGAKTYDMAELSADRADNCVMGGMMGGRAMMGGRGMMGGQGDVGGGRKGGRW